MLDYFQFLINLNNFIINFNEKIGSTKWTFQNFKNPILYIFLKFLIFKKKKLKCISNCNHSVDYYPKNSIKKYWFTTDRY